MKNERKNRIDSISYEKKKEVYYLDDGNDGPYAVLTIGHVPMKQHLKDANKDWDRAWADRGNTFYEYAVEFNKHFRLNVKPGTKKCFPVTISYWEEPYAEQK